MDTLFEAMRIAMRSLKRGFTPYSGTATDICSKIIKDCYNGTYFRTSTGHFGGFYIRDFAWVIDALLAHGHKKEVESTLRWVMGHFACQHITTTLSPKGKALDIHAQGPDSLAMLVYCLHQAKMRSLVKEHKSFLEKEAKRYFSSCFDPNLGLVRRHLYFSSMKDAYLRDSSCYDNCMIAIASHYLDALRLKNPWKGYDMLRAVEKNFWNGRYFCDDLSNADIAGDANIVPLFFGIFEEKRKTILASLTKAGLTTPYPLRYSLKRDPTKELVRVRYFAPNYEGDTIWLHMGTMYLKVLQKENAKEATTVRQHLLSLVQQYSTFPEVLTKDGKPYSSWAYFCDEGMIWAANLL
jgi:hypothetical protein